MSESINKKGIAAVAVVLVVLVGGLAYLGAKPGSYDEFAQCLQAEGATFYGAFWCPHCREQKALFGASQSLIPYVECSTADRQGQLEVCQEEEIQSYPTWKFAGGVAQTGLMQLEQLAEQTGCKLPL